MKSRRRGKRAQIEMGESAAVLFVFIVLIMIGMVVYDQISRSKIKRMSEEIVFREATEKAQQASVLPEISCSSGNVLVYDCIDLDKVSVFYDVSREKALLYFDMFGYANITVKRLYPGSVESWQVYSRVLPNATKRIRSQIPVSLLNYSRDEGETYYLGVLEVESYFR